MGLIDSVIGAVTEFCVELKKDENGRYRSWEHCYECFYKAREQRDDPDREDLVDYLSLHLAFYLASWGDVPWLIISFEERL